MEVPLQWKLSVSGNNEVKSVMSDLNSAFQRGQISGSDYADSMSKVGREANKVNNISRYQNQIFLSMHPNINKLSRGFSTLTSVTRTSLSLITAINTLFTAMNTNSQAMAEAMADVAEAERGINNSVPGSEPWIKWNEQLAIAKARVKELENQQFASTLTAWGIGIIAVIETGAALIKILPTLVLWIKSLSIASMGAYIAFLPIIIAVAAIAAGILLIGAAIEKISGKEGPFSALVDGAVEFLGLKDEFMAIGEFFMVTLPNAIQQAGIFFTTTWELIVVATRDLINWIVAGIEGLVNKFIDAINEMIKAYNATAGKILGTIGLMSHVTLPRIKTDGSWVTTDQKDSSTGVKKSGGVGQGITNNITVMGSILAENELKKISNDALKTELKKRGFTGL